MRAGSTALLTVLLAALSTAQPKPRGNLVIAQQGYLFAGGTYSDAKKGRIMSGQLYAEFQIPARRTHPWPIVMIHGGSQTGTNFTGTPDAARVGLSSSCAMATQYMWSIRQDVAAQHIKRNATGR